ncbi:sialidase family protein [Methylogaea oryzae]|uniref:sialidase family protein n=1 Tax=Methylogaea oryzae TaxID=1295382 RepID=UPI0006D1E076|nr:sialidase family protein [Methylogaea oryzae]
MAVGPEGNVYVTWARGLGQRFTSHILFSRSIDGGKTYSKPRIVNDDKQVIGHSFDSLMVGEGGKLLIAWLDGRDAAKAKQEGKTFNGSTLYYTWSDNGGRSFRKDRPIAAGTCQCCRLQTVADKDGLPVVMWRHILEGGIRDHVLVKFQDWDKPGDWVRTSFEDWKIDACPHHGPGLAVDSWGRYHAVWFSGEPQRGGLFYAYSEDHGRTFSPPQRFGGQGASHPHVAVSGDKVVVAWQEFDGQRNVVKTQTSTNRGAYFGEPEVAAQTEGAADAPFVLNDGQAFYLSWQTQKDGYRLLPLP